MQVRCSVDHTTLVGDYGDVAGVVVTCGMCGHEAEVFGDSGASVRRGCVMLREECPMGQSNWYFAETGEDQDC